MKAMRRGDWILLDEINLAETEMLECLASILEYGQLLLQVSSAKQVIMLLTSAAFFVTTVAPQ